jgi:hypothetical protein
LNGRLGAIRATLYLGKSPLQDWAGRSSHSSSQKPHFEQPPTINPKPTTHTAIVSRLNTRNLTLRCNYRILNKAKERKNVDEWFRKAANSVPPVLVRAVPVDDHLFMYGAASHKATPVATITPNQINISIIAPARILQGARR